MATKQWILFLPLAGMISVLAGCNSGSTANVQNPPPPPPSNVTISVQATGLTNGSVPVNGIVSLAATVQGTATQVGEGVAWSMTCQADPNNKNGLCGTLSSPSSASGAAITYTAPATLSSSSMVTEIVAFAEAQETANNVSPITITTFDSSFPAGNYVLQAQGVQGTTPYQFAGVITLDGQGNVTAGEQTVNSNGASVTDSINRVGSSYFIGSDGRGTITLVDPSAGTEIFSLVFLTNKQNPQAVISQTGVDSTGAFATGTMDLQQTSIAAPSGSYAFVVSGTDVFDNSVPLAFGGVFDIAPDQTITGVADEIIAGSVKLTAGALSAGSKVSSAPDTFGQVAFTLLGIPSESHPIPITIILTGYIVDATHIKLVETDTNASNPTPYAATGGLAIAQAAGSYGNFNNASFSGTYVLGITGIDLSPINSGYTPSTLTTADVLTADGNGDLTSGFTDTFLQLNCVQKICKQSEDTITGAQISSSFTGTYSVDAAGADPGSGTGRTTLNSFTFSAPPSPSYSPTLFFYLTGNGSQGPAALVLATGDLVSNPKQHYPSIGTGVAYAQSSSVPAFSGPYGFRFTQVSSSGENDGTAQMTANSTATPQVSGIADSTAAPPPPNDILVSDHLFSGSFNLPQSNSIFTGTLANYNSLGAGNDGLVFTVGNNNVANDSGNLFDVDYYFIDQNHGFWVETDLITGINGNPGSGQVSFGSYAARTPVCAGCP
ncbi:MAG: hypothetical protein WBE45_11055 [Terriglobales bacterium]